MNPCPKAAMREIRPSGLMSGIWKRAPRYRARSRLYTSQSAREISALWSRSGSGSGGELDLSRPKQGVGLLPRFVSDAGYSNKTPRDSGADSAAIFYRETFIQCVSMPPLKSVL